MELKPTYNVRVHFLPRMKVTKYDPEGGYCAADVHYMTKREAIAEITERLSDALDIAERKDKASQRTGRLAVRMLGWELFAVTRSTKVMREAGEKAAGDSQRRLGIIDSNWDGIGEHGKRWWA